MMKNLETQENIAIPKGSNRSLAQQWLATNDYSVPAFAGSCLHRNC